MASPFSMFRRKQKTLLAVFGVLIMIAFVFSGAFPNMGSSERRVDPLIVETSYGRLKESELYGMVQTRNMVDYFLRSLVHATTEALQQQGQIDARRAEQVAEGMYGQLRMDLLQRSAMQPEAAAVETMILAKKAEQLGIVVSDNTVNAYIKEITADSVTSESLRKIIESMRLGENRRVTQGRLYDAVRTELMASRVSRMFHFGGGSTTPAQRWEYYQRLNRRMNAQVLEVPVANFVGEVAEPTDQQIEQFYAKYRDQYQQPGSPDPGFKEPRRAKFQYFKADYEEFLKDAMAKVTDEEIEEYYEKNKDTQFKTSSLPPVTDEKDDSKKPAAEADDTDTTKPDEDAAGDSKTDAKPEAESTPPAKGEAVDDTTDEQPKASAKPAAKPDAKPDAKSGTRLDRRPLVRLVSDSKAEEKPATDAAADAKPASEPIDEKVKPDDADKTAETDKDSDKEPADNESDDKSEKPKYEPLEKVKEQIRKDLAGEKARKAIEDAFTDLTEKMAGYSQERVLYDAKKATNSKLQAPTPLDFAALAKTHNLAAKETALISPLEARDETDLGKSYNVVMDRRARFGFRQITFPEAAYSESMQTYKPTTSQDDEQNSYLYWKTEVVDENVPPLDKIRDKVVRAWKLVEAREPARKKAEEYAAQARKSKSSLKSMFEGKKGLKVSETGPFSWLTMGSVPSDPGSTAPRESEVPGIEHPGESFMRTAFSLAKNEVGVAANGPQTAVYVIQYLDSEPPMDELQKDFAREDYRKYQSVAGDDQRQMFESWLSGLYEEAAVDWKRPPAQRNRG